MKGPLSPGQQPKITGNRGGGHRIGEGQQQQNAEMQEQMVPWGAGEIVSSPQDGLMQDLAQPTQLQGQQCTWEQRQLLDAVDHEAGKEKAFLLEQDASTVTVSNLAMEVTEDILRKARLGSLEW